MSEEINGLPKAEDVTEVDAGGAHVTVVKLTPENRQHVFEAVMSTYLEPCRICGVTLTRDDLNTAVWAGWGSRADGSGARAAHKSCWEARKDDKANWAYPIDWHSDESR